MPIFRSDERRRFYLEFRDRETQRFQVRILAWCSMTNQVHRIATPEEEKALGRAIGEAHKRYGGMRSSAKGLRGYLFQGRFGSCLLGENHLMTAVRYVDSVRKPMLRTNSFLYAGNDPISWIDPLGLFRSHWLPRMFVPGQIARDNALTLLEEGNYGEALLYSSAMVAEQILIVETLGGHFHESSFSTFFIRAGCQIFFTHELTRFHLFISNSIGKHWNRK